MDKKDLNHYKHLLEQHKEHHMEILDDMENLSIGDNDANNEPTELSNYDNHPADMGSQLFDVEHQMGLKKHQEHELNEIERAEKKIREGNYGKCEGCGKDIDPKRLELLPQTKFCIDCARDFEEQVNEIKADKKRRRPSEEQVTHSSNINDTARGEQFYDVIQYGSSDTHQDRHGEITP